MCKLKRLQVGQFNISEAIELDKLKEKQDIEKYIITIEKLFENNKKIELENKKLQLFLNGVQLSKEQQDGVYKIYNNNKFIGTGTIENGLLKRDIII